MEKLNDLRALLQHEVQDLISAEDQIIAAMPAMIERAQNANLKRALDEHLAITRTQRERLDKVNALLGAGGDEEQGEEKKGIISGLMSVFGGDHICKGMEGIITEGQKVMKADMAPEVMDAAIIACAQKVEHYEICGYGTAKAYAKELELNEVAELLEETLDEEYEADDRLTDLAVGDLNEKAERAGSNAQGAKVANARGSKTSDSGKKVATKTGQNGTPKKAAPSKNATKASGSSNSNGGNKKAATKSTPKKAAAKKR